MLNTGTILIVSFLYMGLLFAIAYWGDKRADEGRSIIANPYIYTLSLAVYCTAWTFYGSVGMAARSGLERDGETFVMQQAPGGIAGRTSAIIILNWFEELKQRVPTGR